MLFYLLFFFFFFLFFKQKTAYEMRTCMEFRRVLFRSLIYFRRWRRREILNNLAERLAHGGILVIGLGEMVDYQNPLLEPIRVNNITAFMRKKSKHIEEGRG